MNYQFDQQRLRDDETDKREEEAPLYNIIQTWNNYIYTKEQWNITSQCVNR
jgi:hypothetical protein